MPVNKKMMKEMKSKYGEKKGEEVYAAVEKKQKGNKLAGVKKQAAFKNKTYK